MRKLLIAAGIAVLTSTTISATTYRLFIHGRSGDNHCQPLEYTSDGTYDHNNYWSGVVSGLSNVRYVGFDGTASNGAYSWSTCGAQRQLFNAANTFCTGSNNCEVYSHSTGGLVVAYFMRYYGSSYNISKIQSMASAAGGSELADFSTSYLSWLGFDTLGGELDNSVSTSGARSWDHNSAAGHTIYTTSGEGSDYLYVTSPLLPGYDDGVLANHSLCSINTVADIDASCTYGSGYVRESYTCWSGWNPFATCYNYFYRWSPYFTVYTGGGGHSHGDAKGDYNK